MKLCEHPDFAALLVATAQATGRNEQFVEKDYYVTEVLRIVADAYGDRVIFKGGTSLSKGWALIDRFSEDVDLFVDPARLSSKWFPRSHRPPPRLSFGESPALFPTADLRIALAVDYTAQCALLFPGDFPSFADVLGGFELLREWL